MSRPRRSLIYWPLMKPKFFKTIFGQKLPLPVFFPDATRAVLKTLDSADIANTQTPGILVNTYHLYQDLGRKVIEEHDGVRGFMSFEGGVISDSGGFQVMTLAKAGEKRGKITDEGVTFQPPGGRKIFFTPEISVGFQMVLKPDMVVVLDDFTPPKASYGEAKETVERTILWAKRSKKEFEKLCQQMAVPLPKRPLLLGIVQGGEYADLRANCAQRLAEIGFDGLGYGGWPITLEGKFNYETAEIIAANSPKEMLLYGLGIGKPEEIVGCVDRGYHLFDCVLPTRDARHGRLYVYNADSIEDIDIRQPNFYSYYTPDKEKHYHDRSPVSQACDCLLCRRYSRAYLAHLFRTREITAFRLATIHNLRFYSLLMEKLQQENLSH
jgi:queuine tRNA-ribosyltransferase